MAIGQRYYTPNPFEITVNGVPYAGARLFFFLYGTATPLDTFQDVNLTVANTNPVVADSNGRFGSIFLGTTQAYEVQLFSPATVDDPVGFEVWNEGPVGPAAGGAVSSVAGIIGEIRAFAGIESSIPATWLPSYGQAVSRTVYSDLFTALGTSWGAGDGSTTFNLPDIRGRSLFGLDNMGGIPAGRVTSGGSGIAGNTLGAHGGAQAVQQHTHVVNDPGHVHNLVDPGHTHVIDTVTNGGGTPIGEITGVSGAGAPPGATNSATTGISINDAVTGITLATFGTGNSANMPPTAMVWAIIYAGV